MTYVVTAVQTIYTMELPKGTIERLEERDEKLRGIDWGSSTYGRIDAIEGVSCIEYYYENKKEWLMFSINNGYNYNDIVKRIKEIVES